MANGYMGKLLNVDLSGARLSEERLDEALESAADANAYPLLARVRERAAYVWPCRLPFAV